MRPPIRTSKRRSRRRAARAAASTRAPASASLQGSATRSPTCGFTPTTRRTRSRDRSRRERSRPETTSTSPAASTRPARSRATSCSPMSSPMSLSSVGRRPADRWSSRSRATRSRRMPMPPPMSSPAKPLAGVLGFERLDATVRAAVDAVASTDPNPADPFRGLYISDEVAVSLAQAGAAVGIDARLELAARPLRPREPQAAVPGLLAAPELSPQYGRLYAYLQDDVTRKLASPRLVARLLADTGAEGTDVLAAFDVPSPPRPLGAIRLLDAS